MEKTLREKVFAGKFYPDSKEDLEKLIQFLVKIETYKINTNLASNDFIGAIVPHAGYNFSGYHAVHVYNLLKINKEKFDTFVIINPNHTGKGKGPFNQSSYEKWETPFGNVNIDTTFAEYLDIEYANEAHDNEHSGEVQLPFLKHFIPYEFKVVLITMNIQKPEIAVQLATKIQQAQKASNRKIMLIASSDFSHYESVHKGFKKDQYVIDQILNLNSKETYHQVKKHNVTACGYGPIMTLIEYANGNFYSPKINLLRRGHSGEVNSSQKVVDYASFLCYH